MKKIVASLLLLSGYIAQAQMPAHTVKPAPDWYFDSVKYLKQPYFDINKIASVDVRKDQSKNGAIYIGSKKPNSFNFISLEQVAKQNITDGTPYLVMIENEFVKDMSVTFIDSSYILKCEKISTKDFKHLEQMPAMIILKIITGSKANVNKPNIMIRGTSL